MDESLLYVHAKAVSKVPRANQLLGNVELEWFADEHILKVKVDKNDATLDPWTHNASVFVDGIDPGLKEATFTLDRQVVNEHELISYFKVKYWLGILI